MEQKGPASVDPAYGGMAHMFDKGIRGGTPASPRRSPAGNSRDPIILGDSDDEPTSTKSEIDHGHLKADLTAKGHSSPYIPRSDMADREGFGSHSSPYTPRGDMADGKGFGSHSSPYTPRGDMADGKGFGSHSSPYIRRGDMADGKGFGSHSSPYIPKSDVADGKGFGFGSGTRDIPDPHRIVADHQDDDYDSDVLHSTRLQLAINTLLSASTGPAPPSPVRVITQGSASHDELNVTKEAEDEGIDAFADDEDNAETYSARRSGSSAVSIHSPAPERNVSLSELQAGQHDPAQSPRPVPAVASFQHSDLINGLLLRYLGDDQNTRPKSPRMPDPTGPARTTRPASAARESNNFEPTQSVAGLVAPAKEREVRDMDYEMAGDGASGDSHYEGYDNMNDAPASEMGHVPRRKRVKRANDTEHNDVETPSTQSLNVACQVILPNLSDGMKEGEEIPIRGYLTVKTIDSKVVYCLKFSHELSPQPGGTSQGISRRVSGRDMREELPAQDLPAQDLPAQDLPAQDLPMQDLPARDLSMSGHVRARFSSQEDELLLQLKAEGLSWDEISDRFPERSKGTLQVHYSTKLKRLSEKPKNTRKRPRSG